MSLSYNITINGQKTSWDQAIVQSKLEKIRDAKKENTWITGPLGTRDNWRITQCIWKYFAKHFDCLRDYLYNVNHAQSKDIFNQIKGELEQGKGENTETLKNLFNAAVKNFNSIIKNQDNKVDPIVTLKEIEKTNNNKTNNNKEIKPEIKKVEEEKKTEVKKVEEKKKEEIKPEIEKVEEKKVDEKKNENDFITLKIEPYTGDEKKAEVKDTGIAIGDFKPKKKNKTVQEHMKKNLNLALEDQKTEDKQECTKFKFLKKESNDLKNVFETKSYKCHSETIKVEKREIGAFEAQGCRNGQEDRHLAVNLNVEIQGKTYTFELTGVFDGHGGDEVSEFVKQNIASVLTKTIKYHCKDGITEEGLYKAFKHACRAMDHAVKDIGKFTGSTAVFTLRAGNKLYHNCVGDARIVVLTKDGIKIVTQDAKPGYERYKKEIKDNGGDAFWGKVNGTLAVARAIGDWEYGENDGKKVSENKGKPVVSADPKITCTNLDEIEGDVYLIHTCDGIWERGILNAKKLKELVDKMLEDKYSLEDIAKSIGCGAIASESRDNITFLIEKIIKE